MADIISANTAAGVYLNTITMNPVVVNPGVTIQDTSVDGYGIATTQDVNWTITNYGTVIGRVSSSNFSDGILLDEASGGAVTNKTGAYIYGARSGVYSLGPTDLVNTGKIVGEAVAGAVIVGSGAVTNAGTGLLEGGHFGLYVAGATGPLTVVNSATIIGSTNAGIFLRSGGAVTNQLGGDIYGLGFGAHVPGSAMVDNSGTIASGTLIANTYTTLASGSVVATGTVVEGVGVLVDDGGYVINRSNGFIRSKLIGVDIATATDASAGTVINQGDIYGNAIGIQAYTGATTVINSGSIGAGVVASLASIGVLLNAGGSVNNTGLVNGTEFGIDIANGTGTVYNQGTVSSSYLRYGAGVALVNGGIVTNASGGNITSTWKGVQIGGATPDLITQSIGGTVINDGVILAKDTYGDGAGVWIHGPGAIINGTNGLISGGAFGIVAYYSNTTVINRGSVYGTNYAFKAVNPNNTNRIIMYPGASFSGAVDANDTIGVAASTLELGSGTSTGTVNGFGSQYRNFTDVQVDSGAAWNFGGTVASNQTIVLAGTQDSLTLENPEAMNATLSGFSTGDLVVLAGVTDATGLSLSGSDVLTISRADNPDLTIQLSGVVPAVALTTVAGATDLTVPCFAAGTMIRTPTGDVLVETIRAGTQVVSNFGGHRQVIWVGQREIDCRRHPKPTLVWPIQIDADAFGPGLPATNLRVSPDHAIYINDALVPARHLVNNDTIWQVPVDTIKYFHIELKTHDVILANSLPAESYLDVGDRSNFSNSATLRLFPDFATPADGIAALWEAKGCAPLIIHGPALDAIKVMLAARRPNRQAIA
jgi:Hint domain